MRRTDFILLVEQYLDGTISPEGRTALREEVQADPEHRRLFGEQTRQHVRLHAQTSRVELADSQRIAVMAIDIAERHRDPNAFMDILRPRTFRERFAIMLRGLHAARNTPAHRAAQDELMRIFGPVTISVVVNALLILLIFCWVPYVLPPHPKPEGVSVTVSQNEPAPDFDPIVPVTTPPGGADAGERIIPVILASDVSTRIVDLKGSAEGAAADELAMGSQPVAEPAGSLLAGGPSLLPKTTPLAGIGALEGRDAVKRADILASIPGGIASDRAVVKSLRWLKAHQAADGSWPGQDPAAMTGLALLAYLAHGEVPASAEFGDTVTRALKYLLGRQTAQGYFSANVYAHAIATYAVAEAFSLTRIVELKLPLDRGVRVILDGQQNRGGFDYQYQKGERFDTSVSGWQIQAMKAARLAGAGVAGLEEGLARAARFLETDAFARDGSGFVYDGKAGVPAQSGGKPSMTGVGTLCLQMLGKGKTTAARTGLKALQHIEFEWPDNGKVPVYSGYYITQAKFQSEEKTSWNRWNRRMQQYILTKQAADGHWEQGDYESGSNVYTTTLCTLMLEVYYRYLPTYAKSPKQAVPDQLTSGDVPVDVR